VQGFFYKQFTVEKNAINAAPLFFEQLTERFNQETKMKPFNFGTKLVWRVFGPVAALAMLAGFVFAPTSTAYADDGTAAAPGGKALEKAYQRELKWLSIQQEHLNKAGEFTGKVQTFIDEQKAKGKDTSALEAALAAFNQQVAAAQGEHDNAASILSAHAGFDENGQVTNREAARETVKSAHEALANARKTLWQAERELRKALKDWRQTNKSK
jgi:hypothetical protein